jgi:hypothetical protein
MLRPPPAPVKLTRPASKVAPYTQTYAGQAICLPLSTPPEEAAKAVGRDGLPLTP